MYKRIIGIGVLIVLIGIFVYQLIAPNLFSKEETEAEMLQNQGIGLIPPNMTGIKKGEQAPDFELETLSGETVKLSDFQGKKVFLNFWASWCGPCIQEMPEMQTFYEEYQDEVEIVAVNLTAKEFAEQDAFDFVEEHGYTYPVLLDRDLKAGTLYSVVAIPTTYFINEDGVVALDRVTGPMTYDMMVKKLKKLK